MVKGDEAASQRAPLLEAELPMDKGKGTFMTTLQRKGKLIGCMVMLLICSVGNQLFFKKMTSAMPNYGFFLTNLTSFVFIPIFALLSGRGMFKVSRAGLQRFAVMGMFDGFAGVFMILGGIRTSGTMQVLLSQSVIPLTLFFTMLLLRRRFHGLQYTGAISIVVGIAVAKLAGGASSGDDTSNIPLFNVLFVLAMVPTALSSIYKEIAFKGFDEDLDVNVLQFWVCCFQVVMNIVAMPIYSLKILGPQQVLLSDMPRLTVDGSLCLFFMENTHLNDCGLAGEPVCDRCQDAYLPVAAYLTFNLLYNMFGVLVIKHGSAALVFLVATLRMPLASLAFSSPAVMGADAVPIQPSDVLALVVVLAGLLTYRYGGRLQKRQMRREAGSPMSSPQGSFLSPSDQMPSPRGPTDGKYKFTTVFSALPGADPVFVFVPAPQVIRRSSDRLRSDLMRRLGTSSPLNSPSLRHLTPQHTPMSDGGNSLKAPFRRDPQQPESFADRDDFTISGLQPRSVDASV